MFSLSEIYRWLHLIFDGFVGFLDILGTNLGELTNSTLVQSSPFGNLTLISLLFGAGIVTYVILTLVKWVIGIIF